MKNDGSESQDAFLTMMECRHGSKNVWIYKFPDTKGIKGNSRSFASAFIVSGPSDFYVTEPEGNYLAEVKSTVNTKSWSFSFQKMQWIAMHRHVALNKPYWVYIHCIYKRIWYRVPASFFVNNKKKSATWEELNDYLY